MELYQIITAGDLMLDLRARNRWEALRELLGRVLPPRGPGHETVLRSLYEAEKCRSSAVGRSVIVAHAVTDEVRGLRVIFGRSERPIAWDAPDGRTIRLLWLLVHSPREHGAYLGILAQIMRLCRCNLHRNELLDAATPAQVIEVISHAACARAETHTD